MSKILVTGGSGFIGTNLLDDLIQKGYTVRNFDISQPQNKEHRAYWEQTDLREYADLAEKIQRFCPDYVIDLAARTDLNGKDMKDYDSNTKAKKNLLKCCKKLGSLKKIVTASSMLVCKTGYLPVGQKDYCPNTYYGKSKAVLERYMWKAGLACDWAVIRPTSVWGPWFGVPYKDFFDMVMSGKYFHIGTRSCKKTYSYIKNAVYQIEAVLFTDTKSLDNKVFYIGDYEAYAIEEWADEIAAALGRKILRAPYPLIQCAAFLGDILAVSGIRFPMTSFRLRNMTTDNIVNLNSTRQIAPVLPYTRIEGIEETLRWMRKHSK